jgi:acetyl-CoA carboxylase carboxyl transferase subunit beta
MGWFLNLVKPKIQLNNESNIPNNLWKGCPQCSEMVFGKEWEAALCVCPKCGFHERIGSRKRIEMLSCTKPKFIPLQSVQDDVLAFKDIITYKDRLKEARAKTGTQDAVLAAEITIEGSKAICFAMDFNFIGGSMGVYVGSAFLQSVELAVKKNLPFIAITASGGARMQEGLFSLMQMPKTILACEILQNRGAPYIVVLTDPTTGGVMASFAMLGDITLAEPNALIGFTGPRVIEETMQIKLDAGFQRSEFQLKHGFIDNIVHRADLKAELAKILQVLCKK